MCPQSKSFIYLSLVVLGTVVSSETYKDPKILNVTTYGPGSPDEPDRNVDVPFPSYDCGKHKWFSIQSSNSGLALDASEPNGIKIQPFAGKATQLWKFEPTSRPGTYYIINKHTKGLLDVSDNGKPRKVIVVEKKTGSLTQQWITNWNGRLRNFGTNLNLDVRHAQFEPGTDLIAWADNGNRAQEFTLEWRLEQN